MKRIKYPLRRKLLVLLILIALTSVGCPWKFSDGIQIYFTNQTQSNIHLSGKEGLRIRKGETSIFPVLGLNKNTPAKTLLLCRDYGCVIEITVVGKEFPDRKEGETQLKDSIVVEEPNWSSFTAYTITGVTTVTLKEEECYDGIDNDNDGDVDNNDTDCVPQTQ